MSNETLERTFQAAVAAVNTGNLIEARRLFEQCLAAAPNNPGILDSLAQIALAQGRVADAVASAQKAVTLKPHADYAFTYAEALYASGSFEMALGLYQQVLAKRSDDRRALIRVGDIYDKHGYRAQAIEHLSRALDLQPGDVELAIRFARLTIDSDLGLGLRALQNAALSAAANPKVNLIFLHALAPHKEWAERERLGLMPFHATSLEEPLFVHAAAERDACETVADTILRGSPDSQLALSVKALCLVSRRNHVGADAAFKTVATYATGQIHECVVFSPDVYRRIEGAPRDDLERGLPAVMEIEVGHFTSNDVVYLSCNADYFDKFGRTLLLSLAKTTRNAQVHLHIMDGADAEWDAIKMFCARQKDLRCAISAERPGLITGTEQAKCYYHAIRFIRLLQHLRNYRRTLWLMDVDALINRDLSDMFTAVDGADVAFRARPGRWEPWHQFNASVAAFRPTERGIAYLHLIAAYIADFHQQDKLRWGIDQLAMYGVHEYLAGEGRAPKVHLLDDRAVDYTYRDDGFVWCNSGTGKFAELKQISAGVTASPHPERSKYFNALRAYWSKLPS